jgi:sulfur-oxidizing protein SoxA
LFVLVLPAIAGEIPLAERRSGYEQMTRDTRAMQDDDAANPGMLWVLEGEVLWQRRAGNAAQSCADCHGDAGTGMRGVAARHPRFDATVGRPPNLEQRINACRTVRQQVPPFAYESRELLALTAYVARQSRGLPIEVEADAQTRRFLEASGGIYRRRQGQLDLACSQCHDDNWGRRLGGNIMPQAHPTGYPLYRLEWQNLGSLQRRLRGCMASLRTQPFDYGAEELVNLELFLMWCARGMTWESPAVRP